MPAAVVEVRDALARVLRDAQSEPVSPRGPILSPMRYYRGLAPVAAANEVGAGGLGYYEFVAPDESPGGFYMQPGEEGHQRVRAWAGTEDDALRLYGWFRGLVHDVTLSVEGHQLLRGWVTLVRTLQDPDGKAWQAAMDYSYSTLDA